MPILTPEQLAAHYAQTHSVRSLEILLSSYRARGDGYAIETKAIEEAIEVRNSKIKINQPA